MVSHVDPISSERATLPAPAPPAKRVPVHTGVLSACVCGCKVQVMPSVEVKIPYCVTDITAVVPVHVSPLTVV